MRPVREKAPMQSVIECLMRTCREEGRWESIILFSSEGLPVACEGNSDIYGEDRLLEFAFSLLSLASEFRTSLPACEITISGAGGSRLVFHYFEAGNEELVLAAVLRHRKGYRRAMKRLVKEIGSLL